MSSDSAQLSTPLAPVRLSAIVLAGGQSSRMGQDKALIEVEGVPLLERVCRVAQSCTEQVYVVTPWVDRYRGVVNQAVQFIQEVQEVQEVSTAERPPGPLVGFAQAIAQLQTDRLQTDPQQPDWVLLLACDLPCLNVKVLQDWVGQIVQTSEIRALALLPRHPQGWWEPLCGFYHRQSWASLMAFVETGGRSFQDWLAPLPIQELEVTDRSMLLNCNTPGDLSTLNRLNRD